MKNLKEYNFSNYCLYPDGRIFSLYCNRFMKPSPAQGYLHLALTDDNGKLVKNIKIHRLVAKVFIPNPENKSQVNHKDGNKLNNHVNNLEWVTPSENTLHANVSGLRKPTFLTDLNKIPHESEIIHDWRLSGNKEFTEEVVHKICSLLEDGYRVCDVSRMTGFDRRYIQHLKDGEKFTEFSYIIKQYDFSKLKKKQMASPETVIKICEKLQEGHGVMQISKELNVDRKLVGNIKNRHTFRTISSEYVF